MIIMMVYSSADAVKHFHVSRISFEPYKIQRSLPALTELEHSIRQQRQGSVVSGIINCDIRW